MLVPLFVVPLVSLLALWGFAASVTLLNALREHAFTTENQRYGGQAQKPPAAPQGARRSSSAEQQTSQVKHRR
jgi:hypothetical protein